MLKFFPVPDPAFPYTLTRENIAAAQSMGIMHNGFSMYIGTLEHFGLDSKGGGLETLPAEDEFVLEDGSFAGKFWADRYNVPEHYVYLDRGEAGPNGPVIRGLQVSPSNSEAGGFSDLSFTVYQNFAGRFYREFAELMNAWGGVPALRLYKNSLGEATKKLSYKYPRSIAIPLKPLPEDGTGFGELVLRFNPEFGHVEFFSPQEFYAAIRQGKFNVADEIQRAKRLAEERRKRHEGGVTVGSAGVALPSDTAPGTVGIVEGRVTAPPPPPPAAHGIAVYEGMEFNLSTGEAIVNGLQTGFYFERVNQYVPNPDNPDGPHIPANVIPWGFATRYTADSILEMLRREMPGETLGSSFAPATGMFQTSIPQRYVTVEVDGKTAITSVNLGLIAAQIARTTAVVSDGAGGTKQVQSPKEAIWQAADAVRREKVHLQSMLS